MSNDNPPHIVDDRELLALSATPATRVFPVLDRARALSPLLVVLAILPAVYAVSYGGTTSADALWGLRAVRMTDASSRELLWLADRSVLAPVADTETAVDAASPPDTASPADAESLADAEPSPGVTPRPHTRPALMVGQPPLATWITVGLMRVLGTSSTLAMSLLSALATGAQLLMLCLVVYILFDARAACWAAFLAAFHGPLLLQIQSAVPTSLTTVCGLGALWGSIAHLQGGPRYFSWQLLTGGVSLALCFLAGGPAAFGVMAVLLLYPLTFRGKRTLARRGPGEPPRKIWLGWSALRSMIVVSLIGLAGGCWWILGLHARLRSGVASDVLSAWWSGSVLPEAHPNQAMIGGVPAMVWEVEQTFVALSGLLLASLVWLSRDLSRADARTANSPDNRKRERSSLLLLLWFGLFFVMWFVSLMVDMMPRQITLLWRSLLMMPAIAVCSFGLEYIMQRKAAARWALAALGLTLLLPFVVPPVLGFRLPDRDVSQAHLQQPLEGNRALPNATASGNAEPATTDARAVATTELPAVRTQSPGSKQPLPTDIVMPETGLVSVYSVAEAELVPSLLRFAVRGSLSRLMGVAILLGLLLGITWRLLQSWASGNDERCRWLLGFFVLLLLCAHAAFGLAGIRCRSTDDETLELVKQDLAGINDVDYWVVLSERPLPLPMRFTLESVWPRATYTRFNSWDAVLSRALTEQPTQLRKMAVVEWNGPPNRPTRLIVPGLRVQQVSSVRFLRANRLRTYTLTQFARPPASGGNSP